MTPPIYTTNFHRDKISKVYSLLSYTVIMFEYLCSLAVWRNIEYGGTMISRQSPCILSLEPWVQLPISTQLSAFIITS